RAAVEPWKRPRLRRGPSKRDNKQIERGYSLVRDNILLGVFYPLITRQGIHIIGDKPHSVEPGTLSRHDIRKRFGQELSRLRRSKGFTQERFAELSGFTQQYVSGLERGRRNPTVVTLYHLAQALGVSHVELITPDDEALRETAKPPKRK